MTRQRPVDGLPPLADPVTGDTITNADALSWRVIAVTAVRALAGISVALQRIADAVEDVERDR